MMSYFPQIKPILGYGGVTLNKNIVALTGGKKKKSGSEEETEYPKLLIEGEEYELGSFVLSGEGPPPHNKRILFTWNCRNQFCETLLAK